MENEVQVISLSNLQPTDGARHSRKRVGRGTSSGHGKTSGRGHKGQNARSGGGVRRGYEGGQTPLFKRLPKRGFTNVNRVEYAVVNVEVLNCPCFDGVDVITPEVLLKAGKINKKDKLIKILGNGTLDKARTVRAHKFSKAAEKAIVDAGGQVEEIKAKEI